MRDTNPVVEAQFRRLIGMRSNEDRLIMGFSMYRTARSIVESAILNQFPGITPRKLKEEIFIRFYGVDFNKTEREKILDVLLDK